MSKQRRLDQHLTELYPELSRRQAQLLCENRRVRINGKPGKSGQLISATDKIEVIGDISPVRAKPELAANSSGFAVIFEDEQLLVVHKPSQMHSIRLSHDDPTTLADCLSAYCPLTFDASPDPRESGLVNRLDFHTEGLAVAAKDRATWTKLRNDNCWIEKSYLALIEGELKEPTVVRSLFRNVQGGEKVEVLAPAEGDETNQIEELAESRIAPLVSRDGLTLVEVKLKVGKRHQVRAHLAWLGHPIVGDILYGSSLNAELAWQRFVGEEMRRAQLAGDSSRGFLLFAHRIKFYHPRSAELHAEQHAEEREVVDSNPLVERLLQRSAT